ncbi:hypothetical protein [Nocardia sp. NPDC050406]|uniref:hypothetical protein n=1 Tax=Nocardia sp. NPDC050406 TaxID=3364318 RepID=UPI00379F8489
MNRHADRWTTKRLGVGWARGRRAEIAAAGVFAALAFGVAWGWLARPGESSSAARQSGAPHPETGQLTYTAVAAVDTSAAATATILGFMVLGAYLIGMFFFSPTPAPGIPRRPRRSGAVEMNFLAYLDYSSSAPGAVFETCIRNSTLLFDFFNRSMSRSIA